MFERVKELLNRCLERKSYAVLVCGFGFLAGVIIHSFFDIKIGTFWLYNAVLAAGAGMIIFFQNKKARLIFLGAFFVVAGFLRFDVSVPRADFKNFFDREMKIQAVIIDEPINKIDKQQLAVSPETISGQKFSGEGKILITTGLYPKYAYGDKLSFYCKLVRPKEFSDFDYAKYLSIQNIGALCYWPVIRSLGEEWPEISIIPSVILSGAKNPVQPARSFGRKTFLRMTDIVMAQILSAKNFLIEKINLALHEPFASFLTGLLVGARSSIPDDLAENFRRTGTAHIVAISGWNITFLGRLFMPVLFIFHLRRPRAFYFMVAAILLYAVFAGFSPSVLRAAIMGVIALYAQSASRQNSAGRALLYSAALMFIINPRLAYDIGLWLSVSATFGLIYFSAIADGYFQKIPRGVLREGLSTTVSAVIFTLPISSFVFGAVSLWSLPANILILPFVAAAIILALPVLLSIIFLPGVIISQILFLPCIGALDFIIKVVNFFGSLPFGAWNIKINFPLMLMFYAALIVFTIKRTKEKNEEF